MRLMQARGLTEVLRGVKSTGRYDAQVQQLEAECARNTQMATAQSCMGVFSTGVDHNGASLTLRMLTTSILLVAR